MDKVLTEEYENPDYPVTVKFVERKKQDGAHGMWEVRPGDVELIIVNNGELNVSCTDRTYKIHAGQGIIISNNARHRITSSAKEDTAFYSVVFSPFFVIGIKEGERLFDKYFPEGSTRVECFALDEENLVDESAIDKINNVIAANTIKKLGYEIVTKGYLCMLWAQLLEYVHGKNEQVNGRNLPSQDELRTKSAIAFMAENFRDPITLDDIAERIHVSKNECCRCFKRVMMATPVEFLIRLRVLEAAKVLYKDPLSVDSFSELAFTTGFNNASYFNKMFKRYMDCTPSEFTKMLKTEPERAKNLYENLSESVTGI